MAMLTGFSLYLIPSWATDSYTTDVALIDGDGNQIGEKRYKHELKLVQQLFLIFGSPFASMKSRSEQMWREVLQDVSVWSAKQLAS